MMPVTGEAEAGSAGEQPGMALPTVPPLAGLRRSSEMCLG